MNAPDIIVRRSIAGKLEEAFSSELSLLPEDLRNILVDDMVTALMERMRVLGAISKLEAYPMEVSD